jgi:hypothetical protein
MQLHSVQHARDLRGPLPARERPALYTHTCCPYAQRVLMAVLHKVGVSQRARTPVTCSHCRACAPMRWRTRNRLHRPLANAAPPRPRRQPQGVPFDLVQVDLSDKPAWYQGVNPRGLVPAVAWRGEVVSESVDVVRRGARGGRGLAKGRGWGQRVRDGERSASSPTKLLV